MTIAAGFRCNEGIVLCADTEITFGDIRQHEGKITTSIYRDASHIVSFAGAGWTDYIHTAVEKAQDGLMRCRNIDDIRKHLEEKLIGFFDGHLANWAYFPPTERPSIELLIGVTAKAGSCDLFYYSGTAFYSTPDKAIGSGAILANNLISKYYQADVSLDQLCHLAIFILSRVKSEVIGCGGTTHMVALRGGGDLAFINDNDVKRLELEMEGIASKLDDKLKEEIYSTEPLRTQWLQEILSKRSKNVPSNEP